MDFGGHWIYFTCMEIKEPIKERNLIYSLSELKLYPLETLGFFKVIISKLFNQMDRSGDRGPNVLFIIE